MKGWLVPAMSVLFLAGCSWPGDDEVAAFSNSVVSGKEFAERYAMYLEATGQRDNIVLRKEILNNMINEQLIRTDLDRRGFQNEPETIDFLERTRTQAILDRYARFVSTDTMTISAKEYADEFRAYNTRATARYLYASTKAGAAELKKQLVRGATFEQLAKECFRDPGLANNGGFLGSFGYGDMEPALEQVAFSAPIGEVSDPFPLRAGYGILKVESRQWNPLASESDFAKVKGELAHTITHRKAAVYLADLSGTVISDLDPVFDADGVAFVYRNWESLVPGTDEIPGGSGRDDHPLVSYKGGSWNVGTFLSHARLTSERQRARVTSEQDVRDVITGLLVRQEFLARAKAAGLEDDPEVESQTSRLLLDYGLKQWRQKVLQRAPEPDELVLQAEYKKRPAFQTFPPAVNVAEVLVRTKEEAESIAGKARRGADFAALARANSIRLWAAEKGGELGFGTTAEFGSLGQKFLDAQIGSIIGPEFVDPYYAVFRILAKRSAQPRSFDEAKEELTNAIRNEQGSQTLATALQDLRKDADIRIDMEVLANIQIDHQAGNHES